MFEQDPVQSFLVALGFGSAETFAWRRKRHGRTVARIESLRAGLSEFNRVSSLLSGWSLSICAVQNAAIAAAEKSERLAKVAMAAAS